VITKLTLGRIIEILQTTPEQTVFDWKQDFRVPRDDDAKGEVIKDLMAIANGTAFTRSDGFVSYGMRPGAGAGGRGVRDVG
jgi:hypothetical protein